MCLVTVWIISGLQSPPKSDTALVPELFFSWTWLQLQSSWFSWVWLRLRNSLFSWLRLQLRLLFVFTH